MMGWPQFAMNIKFVQLLAYFLISLILKDLKI